MSVLTTILMVINVSAIVFVMLVGYDGLIKLGQSLFRLISDADAARHSHQRHRLGSESIMPLSILLPDCDSDPDAKSMIEKLLDPDYLEYEIIAMCDSESNNDKLEDLKSSYDLVVVNQPIKVSIPAPSPRKVYRSSVYSNLIVLDIDCSMRHAVINAGVNVSFYPLLVILGKGYNLNEDTLSELATVFSTRHNVIVTGGLPRIQEDGSSMSVLGGLQETEYLRTFPAGLALSGQNRLSVVLSSFGAFRKQNVIGIGGFPPGGSETEMIVRLSRESISKKNTHKFHHPPNPVLDTSPPRKFSSFMKQRMQWQSDMIFTLWQNKNMLFNPKYGRAGFFDMPYLWLFNVIGPVLECLGILSIPLSFAFGLVGVDILLAFLAVELIFGTIVSLSAVASQQILSSERPSARRLGRQIFSAILNNFGYRQFVLFFQVAGLFKRKDKATAN